MARPPGNADTLMIKAGMELARKNGCSSLRIREVADRAGVNLGMFHYHFKNRFTRILLEEIYGEFFHELTGVVGGTSDTLGRLRRSLILLGRFLRQNRLIVIALFKDVLNEDPGVLKYARENTPPRCFFRRSSKNAGARRISNPRT